MLGGVAVGHRRVQLPEGGCLRGEWIRMRCEAFDKDRSTLAVNAPTCFWSFFACMSAASIPWAISIAVSSFRADSAST